MTETGPSVSQPKQQRPLSPHLQVYKPQLTTVLSIMHRATGIFLTLGLGLFSWWIIALADGPEAFGRVRSFAATLLGLLLVAGWMWALFFHLLTGIRHLFWDAGIGFGIPATYRSGWAIVILSLIFLVAAGAGVVLVRIGSPDSPVQEFGHSLEDKY